MSLENLIVRLEAVTNRLENIAHIKADSSPPESEIEMISPMVEEYNSIIQKAGKNFLNFSTKIGDDVASMSEIVNSLFEAEYDFMIIVSKCKSPDQATFNSILQPIASKISAIEAFVDSHPKSNFINHLKTISVSAPAFGWITMTPTPAPYVKEMIDVGQFYSNRVLKDFKEKDPIHAAWVKSWHEILNELQAFIKKNHTTGLHWNVKGVDVNSLKCKTSTDGKSTGSPCAPPPPGPPPPPAPMTHNSTSSSTSVDHKGLFAELNQGENITKALKKVPDDLKTHKNPELRTQPPLSGGNLPNQNKPIIPNKPGSLVHKQEQKKSKLELVDKKWIIEYFSNNDNVKVEETDMKQTLYIFKCDNSTITIKGKVNAITIDSCKKVGVVFDEAIAAIDFINCQSVKMQVLHKVPTINIDKTDGCMIYLSEESLATQIVAAKSSEMNVLIPNETGEFKEFAVPEQFKTYWDGKKLMTEMTDVKVG